MKNEMNKLALLSTIAIAASASTLLGQFNPLPETNAIKVEGTQAESYADLIASQGWTNPLNTTGFIPAASVNLPNFDPFGIMNVVFLGESSSFGNNFGIHWGALNSPYNNDNSTHGSSEALFNSMHAPVSVDTGHFVSVSLDGRETFDFWLSSEAVRSNPLRGIWSLFNPGMSASTKGDIAGLGAVKNVDGEDYYLFSFRDTTSSTEEADALAFFLHFSNSDGTPFTAVPEPSVYGAAGILLLAGIILRRKLRQNAVAEANVRSA